MIDPIYEPNDADGIWVFLEQDGGVLAPVSLELISKARELARETGSELTGLLAGHDVDALAGEAATLDLDRVIYLADPLLDFFTAEAYAHAVAQAAEQFKPNILLFGATAYGRDLAGRLAVMLRTGLTADCTDLTLESGSGLLLGEVSGFGGGVLATIKCEYHRPQMATVRPGVFVDAGRRRDTPAPVVRVAPGVPEEARPVRVVERTARATVDISRSERLIVAGAGTRGQLGGIEALAKAIGAEVGATRVAVDQGWMQRERQIGQTGIITHPALAIVCGVSGASQFTVGIESAQLVIAINQDPEAPIFEHADVCVVDDLAPVVQALAAEFSSHNGGAV